MEDSKLKHLTRDAIDQMDRIFRANLISSATGYKSANLIGTKSADGISNLTMISSVVHLGSNPPLIGFIQRPTTVRRDTYENIRETCYYTINHVHEDFIEKAHQTSARYDREVSEFDACDIGISFLNDFHAPFVQESKLKLAMKFLEEIPIPQNGTSMILGEIMDIYLEDQCLEKNGNLNLGLLNDVVISGLDSYHTVIHKASFSYAKPDKQLTQIK